MPDSTVQTPGKADAKAAAVTPQAPVTTASANHADHAYQPEWLLYAVLGLAGLATALGVMLYNSTQALKTQPAADSMAITEPAAMKYEKAAVKPMDEILELPAPRTSGGDTVTESLANRRSRREFAEEPVELADLSQVLWSAQGETDESGHRAAPSAKGAYPYTLYVVVRNVDGLNPGLYQYLPEGHRLGLLGLANAGDLLNSAGVQDNSQGAPAVIVMAATKANMVEKFPDANPDKNVYLEGGHIGQNIYLAVESLGMSTVVTGGFDFVKVGEVLQLDPVEEVVYLVPLGNRAPVETKEE